MSLFSISFSLRPLRRPVEIDGAAADANDIEEDEVPEFDPADLLRDIFY